MWLLTAHVQAKPIPGVLRYPGIKFYEGFMYTWSVFCIREILPDGEVLLKNLFTGSVVMLPLDVLEAIDAWLRGHSLSKPEGTDVLTGENAFIVPKEINEWDEWRDRFLNARNNKAHI